MNIPRRDLGLLLPLFAAAQASGQNQSAAAKAIPSTFFPYEEVPAKASGTDGRNKSRQFFNGKTHTGFQVELHETELPPGNAPHAAHHHVSEEMILVREGTMEVTINGKTRTLGPGSVAYVASNEEHGWRNVGKTTARYFIIALNQVPA